jgi:hypothetical protein
VFGKRLFRRAEKIEGRLAACVICFDRAHTLKPVLESLSAQSDAENVDFFFFQDGAVNRFSGRRHARDEDLDSCGRLVERTFPGAEFHRSEDNLGIALNFDRAEDRVFREGAYDYAVFFEDDLLVAPWYLSVIKVLLKQFEDRERVAMIAAYGLRPDRTLRRQTRKRRKLGVLGHHWGFALYRDRWARRQKELGWYLDLVRHADFRELPREEIKARYRRHGVEGLGLAQDGANIFGMIRCSQVKLNTFTNNGRYIGERGTHFTEERFRLHGFDRTVPYHREWLHFDDLDDAAIEGLYRQMCQGLTLARS